MSDFSWRHRRQAAAAAAQRCQVWPSAGRDQLLDAFDVPKGYQALRPVDGDAVLWRTYNIGKNRQRNETWILDDFGTFYDFIGDW